MTVTSRAISFYSSFKKTQPSPPYCVCRKKKNCFNEELPVCTGEYSYCYPLVIDDDLNMNYMSGGNCSLNNHSLSQQYHDSNNGDVTRVYGF